MDIHVCGYSYHTQGFYSQHKPGSASYLFRLQTEGSCEAKINGEKLLIKKGDLLMVHPEDHYELFVKEKVGSGDYYLICNDAWLDEWWSRSAKRTISHIGINETLISLWQNIIIEERRPLSSDNKMITSYLLRALCLSLERASTETSPAFSRPYSVTRMMRYIEEHALTTFKAGDVAQHAGLSLSRSVHLFKSCVGKTMVEYAQEIRLSSAIDRMIYTNMTLEHIAIECGFGSYSYFCKVFKKKYGTAPGAYRRLRSNVVINDNQIDYS